MLLNLINPYLYNIATLKTNGTKKNIELKEVNLYKILKNELSYSYVTFDGRNRFLKETRSDLFIVEIHEVISDLIKYIESNFRMLCKDDRISFEQFYDKFLEKPPIKKDGNIGKTILKRDFDLLDEQIHILKMKSNIDYKKDWEYNELLSFFHKEGYVKTIDRAGVIYKGCELYIREVQKGEYIVFVNIQKHFSLYKISNNCEIPFEKMDENNSILLLAQEDFDLNIDIDIDNYNFIESK